MSEEELKIPTGRIFEDAMTAKDLELWEHYTHQIFSQCQMRMAEKEIMSNNQSCATCKYWLEGPRECRRRSAQVVSYTESSKSGSQGEYENSIESYTRSEWPTTQPTEWCGDHDFKRNYNKKLNFKGGWFPIETIPKDGSPVLVGSPGMSYPEIAWHDAAGTTMRTYEFWMPLPSVP